MTSLNRILKPLYDSGEITMAQVRCWLGCIDRVKRLGDADKDEWEAEFGKDAREVLENEDEAWIYYDGDGE